MKKKHNDSKKKPVSSKKQQPVEFVQDTEFNKINKDIEENIHNYPTVKDIDLSPEYAIVCKAFTESFRTQYGVALVDSIMQQTYNARKAMQGDNFFKPRVALIRKLTLQALHLVDGELNTTLAPYAIFLINKGIFDIELQPLTNTPKLVPGKDISTEVFSSYVNIINLLLIIRLYPTMYITMIDDIKLYFVTHTVAKKRWGDYDYNSTLPAAVYNAELSKAFELYDANLNSSRVVYNMVGLLLKNNDSINRYIKEDIEYTRTSTMTTMNGHSEVNLVPIMYQALLLFVRYAWIFNLSAIGLDSKSLDDIIKRSSPDFIACLINLELMITAMASYMYAAYQNEISDENAVDFFKSASGKATDIIRVFLNNMQERVVRPDETRADTSKDNALIIGIINSCIQINWTYIKSTCGPLTEQGKRLAKCTTTSIPRAPIVSFIEVDDFLLLGGSVPMSN